MENVLIKLSGELLIATKTGSDTIELIAALKKYTVNTLIEELDTDIKRMTFWINIYNAYFLILKYKGITKPDIYKQKYFQLVDGILSLDDIEHGILRRYRVKLSLGYLPNIFVSRIIKQLAVEKLDWRIHFALNCGAKSCPPIAFYKLESLHEQLDLATLSYLESDTEIDDVEKTIRVTQLFKWYQGDFGGKKGVRAILSDYLGVNVNDYSLGYTDYSWEENLTNFSF